MSDRPVFIEATLRESGQPKHRVLISLRAISHIEPNPFEGAGTGSIVYFSGMEDDYIVVQEDYETIIAALGWIRQKKP